MQIGIDLTGYKSPLEDIKVLINRYGHDREIGYIKINPERLPIIVSENRMIADVRRYRRHEVSFTLNNGKFELITDDRAISMEGSDIKLYGNAYIARRQGKTFTALNMKEILDWLIYMNHADEGLSGDEENGCINAYLFKFDAERGTWR